MQKTMTLLFLLIIAINISYSQKWGDMIYLGEKTSSSFGRIYFDSTDKAVFNLSGECYYIDKDTKKLVDIVDSLEYNDEKIALEDGNINIMAWSDHSYMQYCKDRLIYSTNDTTMVFDEVDLPGLETGVRWLAYKDSKYYAIMTAMGKFRGMYVFDESDNSFSLVDGEKLLNCFTAIGRNFNGYNFYKDKLYYYSLYGWLVSYDLKTQEVDTINFTKYHKSLPEFSSVSSTDIKNNIVYCSSFKFFTYYTYNLDTEEYQYYDLKNTVIAEDHEGYFDNYHKDSLKFGIDFFLRADYKGGLLAFTKTARSEEYPNRIYFKPPDGDWKRIEYPDSIAIPPFTSSVDRNNLWWCFGYKRKEFWEEGKNIFAGITFDPYDETSVEETEGMPSIVTLSVHPNPAIIYTDVKFYINRHNMENVSFKIYDYLGNEIKTLDNTFSYDSYTAFATKRVDVSDIRRGIYFLLIDNDTDQMSISFVVE